MVSFSVVRITQSAMQPAAPVSLAEEASLFAMQCIFAATTRGATKSMRHALSVRMGCLLGAKENTVRSWAAQITILGSAAIRETFGSKISG